MRKSVIVMVLLAFSVQNPQRVEAGAFVSFRQACVKPDRDKC